MAYEILDSRDKEELESKYNTLNEKVNQISSTDTVTVDPTYNPESENAQSGKAVAEAVSNFVSLDDKTEWIFDGGDASGSVEIDLVIDNEMSGTSNNLVPNKVIKQYVDNLFASIYPIGSIYMSANDTSPSVLFGGEWERIKDRFLLSAGDNYEAETTGGEAEHTLTVSEMPSHTHNIPVASISTGSAAASNYIRFDNNDTSYIGSIASNATGDGAAHNNMPPYLTVYMWKRIA